MYFESIQGSTPCKMSSYKMCMYAKRKRVADWQIGGHIIQYEKKIIIINIDSVYSLAEDATPRTCDYF